MLILSHRGYHQRETENTLAAFQSAVDLGVDGIETDLRITADGALVLIHDRLTPDGCLVGEVTHQELCRLVGHDVPLAEAALTAWPTLLWNLEIKTPAALPAALTLLRAYQATHWLLVTSFWHPVVEAVAEQTAVECGLLVCHCPGRGQFAVSPALQDAPPWRRRIRTIVWSYEFLDPKTLAAAAHAGYRNYCYSIGTPAEHATASAWGLDGIITDRPEFAIRRAGE